MYTGGTSRLLLVMFIDTNLLYQPVQSPQWPSWHELSHDKSVLVLLSSFDYFLLSSYCINSVSDGSKDQVTLLV